MTVLGLPLVIANMSRIAGQMVIAQGAGLTAAGERIREAWVSNIEDEGLVLTGAYRDSVRVVMDDGEVSVLTDTDYAGVLEYGDSRIEAHPVAERAFDEHADDVVDLVGDMVGRVIR